MDNAMSARSLLPVSTRIRAAQLAVIVLTMASLGVVGAGSAAASQLRCGDTITSDVKLDADLVNCPDNGIVIGADNITLDLNGHTIDGDASPVSSCPSDAVCDVGVVNSVGYDGLTVEGGDIRQFSLGVLVDGGSHHTRLRALLVSHSSDFGIIVANSTGAVIANNRLPDDGVSGLGLISSNRFRVAANTITGTTGYGVFLSGVRASLLARNTLRHDQHGFLVGDDSSRNTLRRNLVTRSGGGFDIGGGDVVANRVLHNRLARDGDAILVVGAHRTVVRDNRAVGTGLGFSDTGGFGILLDGAAGTTVRHNRLSGGRGPAVWVTNLESPQTPTGNVISHNVANSGLDDGIRVDMGATHITLLRNTANHNGDDGLDVQAPGVTVTGNTANFNADLGIAAVPGITDGGGNRAKGNGNPAQCTNIQCR